MRVAIGSDHAGYGLKKKIIEHFADSFEFLDVGTDSTESCDYPIYAHRVCQQLESGSVERGILICGTGIGMSISANRHAGINTAVCHNEFTAERARLHNNATILAMGAEVISPEMAIKIVKLFMETPFNEKDPEQKRHVRRIGLIDSLVNNK